MHLRDGDEHRLSIERATLDSDGPTAPMALTLDGQWDGRHLAANGILGSLKDLLGASRPFPLRLKILLPGLVASLDGTLKSDLQRGVSLAMLAALDLSDSADLNGWIGMPLPSLGSARVAMTLSGRLDHPRITAIDATIGRHDLLAVAIKGSIEDPAAGNGVDLALTADGDAAASLGAGGAAGPLPLALSGHVTSNGSGAERGWRIADLKGSLGHSDLSGQLSLRRHDGLSIVEGRFESALVEVNAPRDAAAEPARPGPGRLFSDAPLPLQLLQGSAGRLSWRIGHLRDRTLDASNIALDLSWRDGSLAADGAVGALAGGMAEAHLRLDNTVKPSAVHVDLSAAHLAAGDLLSSLGLSDAIAGGRLDFRFKASGFGDNPRAILASLQGSSLLSVAPTTVANRLANDGLGAVLAHLSPSIGADRTDLRCLVSHFTLADGLARSEVLLFALGPVIVSGQGSVNLANENLDFTLTPRPAGQSAATPLDVAGSLAHPLVAPNKGAIVKNQPAVSGAAESPLLTLTAAGDGNPCFAALAQGRRARNGNGGAR